MRSFSFLSFFFFLVTLIDVGSGVTYVFFLFAYESQIPSLGTTGLPQVATIEANDNIQDEQHAIFHCTPPSGLSPWEICPSLGQDLLMCLLL